MSLIKLLKKELKKLEIDPIDEVAISLVADNIKHWRGLLNGPVGSPYEDGTFTLEILFPSDYPTKPPKVTMKTPIYHMNINQKGLICLDILANNWRGRKSSVRDVLTELVAILHKPLPTAELMSELVVLYSENQAKYEANARECTRMFAMGPRNQRRHSNNGNNENPNANNGNNGNNNNNNNNNNGNNDNMNDNTNIHTDNNGNDNNNNNNENESKNEEKHDDGKENEPILDGTIDFTGMFDNTIGNVNDEKDDLENSSHETKVNENDSNIANGNNQDEKENINTNSKEKDHIETEKTESKENVNIESNADEKMAQSVNNKTQTDNGANDDDDVVQAADNQVQAT